MPRSRRAAAEDLRRAVDRLPLRTREAMLAGIREQEIIAGAYTDRHGGVCPMLAAHRRGGRTSFIAFARAWDRFTGARRARLASERELRVLRAHLEASILAEQSGSRAGLGLGEAIADHRRLVVDRAIREEHADGAAAPDAPAPRAPTPRRSHLAMTAIAEPERRRGRQPGRPSPNGGGAASPEGRARTAAGPPARKAEPERPRRR